MNPEKTNFIRLVFPEKLQKLKPDHQPLWGIMTPQHMVEHLSGAFAMSRGKFNFSLLISEEQVPKSQAWLRSGRKFGKSMNGIGLQPGKLIPLRFADLEEAKIRLRAEIPKFYEFMARLESGATFLHPAFGELNPEEWEQFHYKHITHHLTQFGLLEPVDELLAM